MPCPSRRLGDGAKMAVIEYIDYNKLPRAKPTVNAEAAVPTQQPNQQ